MPSEAPNYILVTLDELKLTVMEISKQVTEADKENTAARTVIRDEAFKARSELKASIDTKIDGVSKVVGKLRDQQKAFLAKWSVVVVIGGFVLPFAAKWLMGKL